MAVNLDLWQPRPDGSSVDLDIGASLDDLIVIGRLAAHLPVAAGHITADLVLPAVVDATMAAQGHLAGTVVITGQVVGQFAPHAELAAAMVFNAELSAAIEPDSCHGSGWYDINVYRDPSSCLGSRWEPGGVQAVSPVILSESAESMHQATGIAWNDGEKLSTAVTSSFESLARSLTAVVAGYDEAAQVISSGEWLTLDLQRQFAGCAMSYSDGLPRAASMQSGFLARMPQRPRDMLTRWIDIPLATHDQSCGISHGRELRVSALNCYEEAILPLPGARLWPDDPDTPDEPGAVDLNFKRLRGDTADLEFYFLDRETVIIPVRGVYIVTNKAEFYRVSDGRQIPTTDISVVGDYDSWAWQFSASVPRTSDAEAVDGDEVAIIINGHESRHLVDGWSDSLSWGQQSATITGRSLSAELSASMALTRSYTEPNQRLLSQLAQQELPTGWALDWQAADWLIPAGVWTYSNLAPIDAIAQLAEAAGAFILPDMASRKLTVMSKYPVAPWSLTATDVDISIPGAIMVTRGRQPSRGQNADGVWISSAAGQLQALIRRQGTAGANLLADVSNSLITEVAGARALGISLLAESRNRSVDTIELPISSDTGLIIPGRVIETPDGIGYARSLRKSARMSGRTLVVRQTIEVERPRLEV